MACAAEMAAATEASSAPGTGGDTPPHGSRPHPRGVRLLLLLVLLTAVALAVARPLVVETFRITTGSMVPTLRAGDRALVDALTYDLEDVRRGDVVAFEDPEHAGGVAIKRVVALPGDTISIRAGSLLINGVRQREAYLGAGPTGSDFFGPTVVPLGHLFVLGDNRARSVDSRFTGAIPVEDLLGRVVARVWPPGRAALL
jgi:signal peptidase I